MLKFKLQIFLLPGTIILLNCASQDSYKGETYGEREPASENKSLEQKVQSIFSENCKPNTEQKNILRGFLETTERLKSLTKPIVEKLQVEELSERLGKRDIESELITLFGISYLPPGIPLIGVYSECYSFLQAFLSSIQMNQSNLQHWRSYNTCVGETYRGLKAPRLFFQMKNCLQGIKVPPFPKGNFG